jgi:hypothetical protein
MNVTQRQAYVKQKADERKKVQDEIQALNKKRSEYIAANTSKEQVNSLDASMMKAVKEKAKQKNLSF